jgi:hypothetical protein
LSAKQIGVRIEIYLILISAAHRAECEWKDFTSDEPRWKHGTIYNPTPDSFVDCKFKEYEPDYSANPSYEDILNAMIGLNSYATFYDFSQEFPKGFGYALFADAGAGGSVSAAVVETALAGRKAPPQVDPEALKKIWATGTK